MTPQEFDRLINEILTAPTAKLRTIVERLTDRKPEPREEQEKQT
jgi:hypothetical protein